MTEPAAEVAEGQSRREPLRWFAGKRWFWFPIVPLVALDLWSKAYVFALLSTQGGPEHARSIEIFSWGVNFELVQWRNTGTIWGLGQDFTTGLIVLRFIAMAVLIYIAARTAVTHRFQQCVLGLIMSGAIGNTYDNLTQPHRAVRDFLKFSWGEKPDQWVFPAFNVADSCICVGAFTLAFLLWREDVNQARAK